MVTLLKAKCVDHKNSIYLMDFWATNISECEPPETMIMCGGSTATITDSDGVRNYVYNSSSEEWKEMN